MGSTRWDGEKRVRWGQEAGLSWLAPTSLLLLLGHTPTCFLLPYWGSELSAEGGSGKGYGTSVCVLTTKVFTVVQDGRPGHLMSFQRAAALLTPANKVGVRPPPSQAGRHTGHLADARHSEPHLSLLQHPRAQQEDWHRRTL